MTDMGIDMANASSRLRRSTRTDRRQFIKQAAVAAGSLSGLASARGELVVSPNEKLNVALVGLGGMGASHLDWCMARPEIKVTALCDVDANHLSRAQQKAANAKSSKDFREIVGANDVDAVFVATPDHWHGLVATSAARAGKHIYCEKPLANSIGEGRAIADAVSDAGVVLQTGSMERSSTGANLAKRLIAEGKLGDIRRVRINLPNADPHLQAVENFTSPPPNTEPPTGLDYDFWLGHTPEVPYNEKRCHFWWRFHSAYGGGEITDRGAHVIDLAHYILDLDDTGPTRIEATGKRPKGDFYDAFITFQFENQYESGLRMVGDNSGQRGVTFEGTEGKLFVEVHGGALTAEPASLLEGLDQTKVETYGKHRETWLAGVLNGQPVNAPAEAGHRTATVCHLNNLAMRLGRGFDWDPQAERSSDPEVNSLLTPDMREPWSLKDV